MLATKTRTRKFCPGCGKVKSLAEFHVRRASPDGYQRKCKPCMCAQAAEYASRDPHHNLRKALRRHGITLEQYREMAAAQGHACAICRAPSERLQVDHDHRCCSGQWSCGDCIRGLLCQRCNTGLFKFGDDQARIQAAADYLRMR